MKEQIGYVPPPYIPLDSSDSEDDTDQVNQEQDHHSFNEDTQDRAQWSSGICACFDDMPSCCVGLFCPCLLFGKNAEFLGSGTLAGSCMTHFILWGLVNMMCCLLTDGILWGIPGSIVACYACGYRQALRSKYNLQEAPCGDLTTHLFCHLCAICQEYREIHDRSGNSGSSDLQLVVTAPSVQVMEHSNHGESNTTT